MQVVKHGGLSGKARTNHKRNRAARLYATQLIEEYFEPGSGAAHRDRYIPVRGRSEFLPSAHFAEETAAVAGGASLALRLAGHEQNDKVARPIEIRPKAPQRKPAPAEDVALRFPATRKPAVHAALKPPVQFRRKERFTVGGFLFGCMMGSAAAALVLLLVQIAVG